MTLPSPKPRLKAIALLSGGLDSLLAAKLVQEQGVEVVGLHLLSPFGCREDVQKTADKLGITLIFKEKGPAYLDLVENPRFGYGKNMNPCIDCRVFMFQLADVVRQDIGADFIVTGEVLGQRPMSQHRHAFEMIDAESPLDRLVVRPLSAGNLAPTIPEEKGWVDREKFMRITGRSRKPQFELAEKLGITEYSQPGGGCLLTDANFSVRLKDFFDRPTFANEQEKMGQSDLLSVGRYFRLSDHTRVGLGRNQDENRKFAEKAPGAGGLVMDSVHKGPTAVLFGAKTEAAKHAAAALIAYYSGRPTAEAEFTIAGETERFHSQQTFTEEEIKKMRIGVT